LSRRVHNSGAWRQDFYDDGQVDDLEYLDLVLGDLLDRGIISGDNAVYLTGLSNGGGMVLEAARRADELLRIGYLHRRCPQSSLERLVDEWARRIAGLAPLATQAMIAIADRAAEGDLDDEFARQWVKRCNESKDLREGLSAAIDKRPPVFKGE